MRPFGAMVLALMAVMTASPASGRNMQRLVCTEGEASLAFSVVDETGGAIPGAEVLLQVGAAKRRLQTDSTGTATTCAPAGRVRVEVSAPAFQTYKGRATARPRGWAEERVTLKIATFVGCMFVLELEPPCRTGPLTPPERGYRWCAEDRRPVCGR